MHEMHPVHEASEHLPARSLAGPMSKPGQFRFPGRLRPPSGTLRWDRFEPGADLLPILPDALIGMYYTG